MDLLPPDNVQSALLDALALLLERRGFETFVRAPLVEPGNRCFPDPWEPSARGVRALALRLLAYAELEDLDANVELFSNDDEPAGERSSHRHEGVAAWFAGIVDDTCLFGADRRQLREADAIVGTMCHEVAHAYRRRHEIESSTRRIEEEHTDITTIYLGFGVLAVNNAQRYRTSGGAFAMRWSTTETGYLPLQAMAFLFAAQCVTRGLPGAERSRLSKLLESNQSACFDEACRTLARDVDGLRARLGVPPVELWPDEEPRDLPALRDDALFDPRDDEGKRATAFPFNAGRGVFRVAHTLARRAALVGAVAFGGVGAVVADHFDVSAFGVALVAGAVGAYGGALLGRRAVSYTCSELRCGHPLASGAVDVCPKCGGSFRGTLDHASDRLEAEEALERGRNTDDLRRELASRQRRGSRLVLTAVGVLGAVLAGSAIAESLPRASSVDALRHDPPELRRATIALTGTVVEPVAGDTTLVSEDGRTLVPFRLDDGTGRLLLWCQASKLRAPLAKGDHVRVIGQSFLVDSGEDGKHVRFIASSVEPE